MTKKTIYILSAVTIAIVAVLIILKKTGKIGDSNNDIEVEFAKISQTTIIETVSATGKIQPEVQVKISSMVSGEVIALPVKEGQVVKKGDLLVKINPDLYTSGLNRTVAGLSVTKASLSQADASFNEAKTSFERNKTLFEKGIISRSDFDKATANFD